MDFQDLAQTALRTVVIYVFILIVMRFLGKRTVGNFTAFDLIVAFIISEVVDEPIYGDVPLVQALLVIALVAALHYGNSLFSYLSPAFDHLTGGSPRLLIKDGQLQRDAMRAEHVPEAEVESLLREQQIDDIREVKLGTLEVNGQLSVIKTEQAKELQKGDLPHKNERK